MGRIDDRLPKKDLKVKIGRRTTAGTRDRSPVDVDATLEVGAWVLSNQVSWFQAKQLGREEDLKDVHPLSESETEQLAKMLNTLASTQGAVEAAKERMAGRLDMASDEELYARTLKYIKELGSKLGRVVREERVVDD